MKDNGIKFSLAFVLAVCCAMVNVRAQNSWTNRYNGPGNSGDAISAMVVDSNGNIFVTGSSSGIGSQTDYTTIGYSSAGVPLWTNRYNGPANTEDVAVAIAVDSGGNVFVTGSSTGVGTDYATIKYSNAGVPLWTNRYNGPGNSNDSASGIAVDANGNVFVTGQSPGGFTVDYATIKYSNAGVPLWTNRFNGGGATAIATDGNGNVFVTGFSYAGGSTKDFTTIKYSNAGGVLWTNRYKGNGIYNDLANALAVDGDGNVIVSGTTYFASSTSDYITIKYSSGGVPLWTNFYNGPGNDMDEARAIAVGVGGNVFVTGYSYNSSGNNVGFSDFATVKYSNAGVPLWTNRYNGPGNGIDQASGIAADSNGNVFVVGRSDSVASLSDFAAIKYSNNGVPLWTNRYNGPENNNDQATALAVDGSGSVFVGGYSSGIGSVSDYATIKYAGLLYLPAVLENTRATGNNFSFDLVAESGGQFAIKVSTNLLDWTGIRQVVIPAGGRTNVVEALSPAPSRSFYRAERL